MAWVILIASGVLEAVWATALGKSEGFTKLWPSVIFFGNYLMAAGALAEFFDRGINVPKDIGIAFFGMINGRGWICVALVVFASWRPGKALLGALLFAFFDALQLRLQQAGDAWLPYQVYLMLPYLLSILALVLVARKAAYPQALMKPYRKGER